VSGIVQAGGLCRTKISVTLEPITSEQATLRAAAALHTGAGLQVVKLKLPARVACKFMNRVQEQQHHLALANRQIAELTVQIVRQRVIVKHALDTGQRSEMAESLLDALEGSLRIFEKHRIFLLSLQRQPSE
jgi:xanthine/CO dehydrogenase XdhC/CoxF family maturation factor